MKSIIAETSLAKVTYDSREFDLAPPGSFCVFDKLREEPYWEVDCYDGGEGWGNKDPQEQREIALSKFVELNRKLDKLLTEQDRNILREITEPIMVKTKNPKYWKQ